MRFLIVALLILVPRFAHAQWTQLEDDRVGSFVSRDTVLRISSEATYRLEISTDAGLTWSTRSELPALKTWKLADTVSGRELYQSLQFHYPGVIYLGTSASGLSETGKFATYGRLFRSTDLGLTWSKFPSSGIAADIVDTSFGSLEMPTPNGLVIHAGKYRYETERRQSILTSQDRGETWKIADLSDMCVPAGLVRQTSGLLFFSPDTSYYHGYHEVFLGHGEFKTYAFSYFTINGWQTCDAPSWDATDRLSDADWLRRSTKVIDNKYDLYEIYHRTDMRSGAWSLAFSDTVDRASSSSHDLVKFGGQWLMTWRDSLILRSSDEGRSWSIVEGLQLPVPWTSLSISVDSSTLFANGLHWYRLDLPLKVETTASPMQEIQIWPNPASSEIGLQVSFPGSITYTISDCLGRQCKTGETDPTGKISIADLLPAAYYLACSQGVAKFIKR